MIVTIGKSSPIEPVMKIPTEICAVQKIRTGRRDEVFRITAHGIPRQLKICRGPKFTIKPIAWISLYAHGTACFSRL